MALTLSVPTNVRQNFNKHPIFSPQTQRQVFLTGLTFIKLLIQDLYFRKLRDISIMLLLSMAAGTSKSLFRELPTESHIA